MKKYLVTAVLIVSFSSPACAVEAFYIVLDNTTNACTIMTTEPADKTRYEMIGKYNSEAEAKKAMATMRRC